MPEEDEEETSEDTEEEDFEEDVVEESEPEPETMDDKVQELVSGVESWADAVKKSDGDMKLASQLWRKVKAYRQLHADEIKALPGGVPPWGKEDPKIPKMAVERKLRGALTAGKVKVDDRLQAVYNYYRENEGYDGSLEDFMSDFPIHAAKEMDGIEPAIIKSTVSDKKIFAVSKTGKQRGRFKDDDGPRGDAAEALELMEGSPMQQVLEVKLDGHKLDQELQRLKIQKMRGELEGDKARLPDDTDKMEIPMDIGDGKVALMKLTPFQYMMMENVKKSSHDSRINPVIETTGFLKDVGLIGAGGSGSEEAKEQRQEMRDMQKEIFTLQLQNTQQVLGHELKDLGERLDSALQRDDFDEYLKLKEKLKAMGIDPDDEKATVYAEQRKMTETIVQEVRSQGHDMKELFMPLAQAQAEVIKRQTVQQTPQQQPQQPQQTQEDWGRLYGGYLAKEEAERKDAEAKAKAAQQQAAQ